MKILTKAFLFIFVAFIFSSNVFAAEADWKIDQYALDTVYSLGIVDEMYELNKEVTRAEFTRIMLKLKRIDETAGEKSQPIFYDVDLNSEYYAAINAAAQYGLVFGYGDGRFYPSRTITTYEAEKMCVRVLGLSDAVAGNTDIIGNEKLNKNIPSAGNMTYGYAVQLAFNVLNAGCYSPDLNSNGYIKSGSYMKTYWDMEEISGQVNANERTGLFDASGTKDDCIKIGDTICKTEMDANFYLGYDVNAYIQYDEEMDEHHLISIEKSNKNKEIVVNAQDILPETRIDSFVYQENNSRRKQIDLYAPDFIYNGVHYANYVLSDLAIDKGTVTFIDSDGNNEYDVVKVEKYQDIFVSAVDVGELKIYDQYGLGTIDLKDVEYELLNSAGNPVSLSALSKNAVISVYESKNVGEQFKKIVISNKAAITGTVKGISTDEETVLNIDGTDYVIDANYLTNRVNNPGKMPAVTIGMKAIFHLNFEGIIVAVEKGSNELKYGYLTKIRNYDDNDTGKNVVSFKIFSEDGSFITVVAKEKIKINGTRDNSIDIISDYSAIYSAGAAVPQLIRYKLNEKQELSEIEFSNGNIVVPHRATTETLSFNGTVDAGKYLRMGTKLDGKYIIKPSTIIFAIPVDLNDEDDFAFIADFASGNQDVQLEWSMKIYDCTENYVAGAAVATATPEPHYNGQVYHSMIKKIVQTVNEDDEIVPKITFVRQGVEYEGYAKDSSVTDGIGRGDLVRLVQDSNGIVIGMKLVFKNSDTPQSPKDWVIYKDKYNCKAPESKNTNFEYEANAPLLNVYGTCLGREDNVVSVTGYNASGDVFAAEFESNAVYILDTEECSITTTNFEAIAESASYTNLTGSKIFLNVRKDLGREIYIIK